MRRTASCTPLHHGKREACIGVFHLDLGGKYDIYKEKRDFGEEASTGVLVVKQGNFR
jgi:hypothetical protein